MHKVLEPAIFRFLRHVCSKNVISVAMRQYSRSGPREVGVLAVSVRAAMFK